ncbi:MAG TPA: tRNA lysidine(34) synthetase TilS [Pseudogracilibacillus sp.]|nr:tRNA lysidine(34) synthetase TilS [Pseudogracilibacillus sp.]
MEQKLIPFLKNHHIELENKKVVVAVSGGPDSVALLHFFKSLRRKMTLQLTAVTVNHQLRKEAVEDVAYVERLCEQWDVPLISEQVDVQAYQAQHKVSTQVAARESRYAIFRKVMKAEAADYLALGHHGDDQIETLVMSLMRTTNLAGMTGIPFTRSFQQGNIIRPLLAVTRQEIESYCAQHHLQARIDPSNEDLSYTRNYVRKRIVPSLKEKNPSLHLTIQQLAESLREDEEYLRAEAEALFDKVAKYDRTARKVRLDIASLKAYAVSLQRRIYRLTLDYLYDNLPPHLSHSHEQIFLSLMKEDISNRRLHFPQNLIVEVVYGQLEFYFNEGKEPPFNAYVHSVPTTVALPDGKMLEIEYTTSIPEVENDNEYYCHISQVKFPLQIRRRKPGDRMRYKGLNGSKKIKDIFIDEKIARAERDKAIIVADDTDEVFWLIGLRKGLTKRTTEAENLYLSFTYKY